MNRFFASALGAGLLLSSAHAAFAASTIQAFGPSTQYQQGSFVGNVATRIGDVNGDGKADGIAFTGANTFVMLSNGTSFGTSTMWSSENFTGNIATRVGDVNGDGKADAIAFTGDKTFVMLSNGTGFGPSTLWSSSHFAGSVATDVADVNGDGRADVVAFNGDTTQVMLSWQDGDGVDQFIAPSDWSTTNFTGNVATKLGDVDGDGRADAVAFTGDNTFVMLSQSNTFTPPKMWSSENFTGNVATELRDVNGDHKADAIAFTGGKTYVMLSYGDHFGPSTLWSEQSFVGDVATTAGDVNGDGRADAVAFTGPSTWVMLSRDLPSSLHYHWDENDFGGGGTHPIDLTLNSDGSYSFTGDFWENTFPGCNPGVNDAVAVAIQALNGDVLTFSHSGHMAGCGSQNDSWSNSGTNGAVASHWVGLQGATAVENAQFNIDLGSLWDTISKALAATSTVISIVGAVF